MVIGAKTIGGLPYVEALLTKIKIQKQLFVYEVEKGGECFIPNELSQDELPKSFRYYDPIIAIVADGISD